MPRTFREPFWIGDGCFSYADLALIQDTLAGFIARVSHDTGLLEHELFSAIRINGRGRPPGARSISPVIPFAGSGTA